MASYFQNLASGLHGNRCAGCANYRDRGCWSSVCLTGGLDPESKGISANIVRADTTCPRFTPAERLAA